MESQDPWDWSATTKRLWNGHVNFGRHNDSEACLLLTIMSIFSMRTGFWQGTTDHNHTLLPAIPGAGVESHNGLSIAGNKGISQLHSTIILSACSSAD
jgi:hypothetical protein